MCEGVCAWVCLCVYGIVCMCFASIVVCTHICAHVHEWRCYECVYCVHFMSVPLMHMYIVCKCKKACVLDEYWVFVLYIYVCVHVLCVCILCMFMSVYAISVYCMHVLCLCMLCMCYVCILCLCYRCALCISVCVMHVYIVCAHHWEGCKGLCVFMSVCMRTYACFFAVYV